MHSGAAILGEESMNSCILELKRIYLHMRVAKLKHKETGYFVLKL